MQYRYTLLALFLFLISFFVSKSQTYLSDPAFTPPVLRQSTAISAMAEQQDGKVIIAGAFEYVEDDSTILGLARLNLDRTLDKTFKISIKLTGRVLRILEQQDGKILAIGDFTWNNNGVESRGIIRFNTDGSLDEKFGIGSGATGPVIDIRQQQDGKILIVGHFTGSNGKVTGYISRLNEDGSHDTSFEQVNANNSISRVRIQKDGKICIMGFFDTINGIKRSKVARLFANGSLDESFIYTYNLTIPIQMELQSDDKVIIGGYVNSRQGGVYNNMLIRLNADGSIDNTYNTSAIAKYDHIFSMSIQSDNKVVVNALYDWMSTHWMEAYIFRVNTDGSLDNTFLYPFTRVSYAEIMLKLSNDKLLMGGGFGLNNNKFLLQLKGNGTIDDVNITDIEIKGIPYDFIKQPDKKTIARGSSITRVNGNKVNQFFRINENGSLDTGFTTDKSLFISTVQPDGKIIANQEGIKLFRLHADGTLDNTFNLDQAVSSVSFDVVIQPDNQILVAGTIGINKRTVLRLNPDGSLDNTFTQPIIKRNISSLLLQTDGKIIVESREFVANGGIGTMIEDIIRLNPDGSLDNTFVKGEILDGIIYTLAMQTDGKIIAGGQFNIYNGYSSENIIRLNSNGSIDSTFKGGKETIFNSYIKQIFTQQDGKILIQGPFTAVNQAQSNGLVQLNADGSLDTTFDLGIPVEKQILAASLQSDGKIVVGIRGGIFKYYTPLQHSILFAEISDKQIGDPPFGLTATASSGLPVNFELVSGPATVTGKVVTLTGEQGPVTIKASQAGNIYYKAASSVERTFQVQPVLGIEDEDALKFKVYPNPAPKQFNITFDSRLPVKNVYLSNIQGKLVGAAFYFKSNSIEVSAPTASPGVYILHVIVDKGEFRKRVVLF